MGTCIRLPLCRVTCSQRHPNSDGVKINWHSAQPTGHHIRCNCSYEMGGDRANGRKAREQHSMIQFVPGCHFSERLCRQQKHFISDGCSITQHSGMPNCRKDVGVVRLGRGVGLAQVRERRKRGARCKK